METWNSHPMRTCGNMSPLRYEFYRSEFSDADLVSTKVDESYGIDDGGPVTDIQTQNHIEVPRVSIN